MNKGRIIYAAILLAVFGVFGGVYKFYFEAKLKAYSQDDQLKNKLEGVLEDLETTFSNTDPDLLTREWRTQIVPWGDAIADRASFFTMGNWFDHEMPPKEVGILKFWYDQECRKMLRALYEKVGEKMGRYDLFPQNIMGDLEIPTVDDWATIDVTEQEVNRQLARLSFGISACQLLLEAKASSISEVVLWPTIPRAAQYGKLLNLQTVGMSFTITAKNLVSFFDEKLRLSDRYFSVNAMRIKYPYIAVNREPELEVELLVTQASFAKPDQEGGGAAAGPGQKPNLENEYTQRVVPRAPRAPQAPPPEPGFFGKAWKLFKRYVLVMN